MNRRMGAEAVMGVGMVSREAVKSSCDQVTLEKVEHFCRRRKSEKALPYLFKAMEAPNCLEAAVQMAFVMPTMDMGIGLLDKQSLLETWPYMRMLQAIVCLPNTVIEMLRLCPGDNLCQREWLGSVLLQAGRTADAPLFRAGVAWQYLRIAACVNPHVFLKVLAKVESADLWVAPDVWERANSDDEVKSYVLKNAHARDATTVENSPPNSSAVPDVEKSSIAGQACQKRYRMPNWAGRTVPHSQDVPIVASADFTSAGIFTMFH
ncbi:hypothetical protein BD414DRAFT_519329 [Trametes punicea]|nr:hypothetical protein BD414DRAFT_519329 [Trametes punicea]